MALFRSYILRYNKSLASMMMEFFQFYLIHFEQIKEHRHKLVIRLELNGFPFHNDEDSVDPEGRHKVEGCERQQDEALESTEGSVLVICDPVDHRNNVATMLGYTQFEAMHLEFARSFFMLKKCVIGERSEIEIFGKLVRDCEYEYCADIEYESLSLIDCDSDDSDGTQIGEESIINYIDA